MKKEEYMSELKKALEGFDEELVQEIITDYEEHFRVGLERGRSEEELIEELGTAEDLVEEINEVLGVRSQQKVAEQNAETALEEVVRQENKKAEPDGAEAENGQREGASSEQERGSWNWSQNDNDREKISNSIKDAIGKAMEQANKAIDIATKEMKKIDFDKIMKEAGDAMNEASQAVQESFRKQKEKWKENAGEAEWNWNWSSDSQNRKRAWDSEQGKEGCRRIVIQGEFADVTLEETDDVMPSTSYMHNSYKDSIIYPFYSYQEGDTFYIGFKKDNENAKRKSGFFRMNNSCSAELIVSIPKGVECVELTVTSGDVKIERLSADRISITSSTGDLELSNIYGKSCKIKSVSGGITLERMQSEDIILESSTGDMELQKIQGGRMQVKTVSGDLNMSESSFAELQGRFTSGDVELENVKADKLHIETTSGDFHVSQSFFKEITGNFMSGDVEAENVEANSIKLGTGSGSINLQEVKAEVQKLETRSGDVEVDACTGKQMEVSVSFGDIHVSAEYETYRLHGNSGDIELCSHKDADVEAENSFGDINIEMRNIQSFYKVSAHSLFGDTNVSGQKKRSDRDTATRTITAKANSGDINVDFI